MPFINQIFKIQIKAELSRILYVLLIIFIISFSLKGQTIGGYSPGIVYNNYTTGFTNRVFGKCYASMPSSSSSIYPGFITDEFVANRSWQQPACGSYSPCVEHLHKGLDQGSGGVTVPIYSPVPGTIVAIGGSTGKICIYNSTYDFTFIFLHCSSIDVSIGQNVSIGTYVGYNGSEGATAIHLHSEIRIGNKTSACCPCATIAQDPVYDPRIVVGLFDQNILALTLPQNFSTGINIPVSFDWDDVSGTSPQYRIQVSTSNSGWTATNGFTTLTSPSASIPVNYNTGAVSSYSWSSGTTGSYQGPSANTTYYWTVRTYVCGQTSNYSPVHSFSTGTGGSGTTYCSGTTNLSGAGTLDDGSGSDNYGNNSDCKWLINSPGAVAIILHFITFDTEYGYDFVTVYDGSTTSAQQLGSFSGNSIPADLTSSGSTMLIHFTSDISQTANGWNAEFSSAHGGGGSPNLTYYNQMVKDGIGGEGIGNNNGNAEPGEEIDLEIELYNSGDGDAVAITAILSTNDPDITITDDGIGFPDIIAGTSEWGSDFDFSVSTDCPDKDVTFTLDITSDEGSWTEDFMVHIFGNNSTQNYTISTSVNPLQGGTTIGDGVYQDGYSLIIGANPNTGYSFANWTENGVLVSDIAYFPLTVNGDREFVANFISNPSYYTITTTANPPSGGLVSGSGTYQSNQNVLISASANNGYSFSNWTANGTIISYNANFNYYVTSNASFVANFTQNPISYYISASPSPTNGGSISGSGTYSNGQTCIISAYPNSGFSFAYWTENGSYLTNQNPLQFTVNGDRNFIAIFTQTPVFYNISTTTSPLNGGTTTGSGTYQNGQTCTISANANPSYTFSYWTENGSYLTSQNPFTFNVFDNQSLIANFSCNQLSTPIVSASDSICGTVEINWSNITNASNYHIYRNSEFIASTSALSYSDYPSTIDNIMYSVQAVNSCSYSAMGYNNGAKLSVPETPWLMLIMGGCGYVPLCWDTVPTAIDYLIYRNDTLIATTSDICYNDYDAPTLVNTNYKVYSRNQCGTSWYGDGYSVFAEPIPSTPVVTASDGTFCDKIEISWTASLNADYYDILRNGDYIMFGENVLSFTDTTATQDTNIYEVIAMEWCASEPGVDKGSLCALPSITTKSITNITSISALSGGNIINDGGTTIVERGICWSTNQNPTINSSHTIDGAGIGNFTSEMNDLLPATTFYVRAYATNSADTAYGNEVSFTTNVFICPPTVSDFDGNIYNTIAIGNQCWVKENMKATHYSDGTAIQEVYAYNNDENIANEYGRLYTWDAIMNGQASSNLIPSEVQGVCPTGWHVPSSGEYHNLIDYLGDDSLACGMLKEQGNMHWDNPNTGATNSSGFSALGSGAGLYQYYDLKQHAYFWTTSISGCSTDWAVIFKIDYDNSSYGGNYCWTKAKKLSVRCIKDNTTIESIEEIKKSSIKIYPNPIKDEFIIESEMANDRIELEIYNTLGQIILKDQFFGKKTVHASNLSKGIYLIRLTSDKLQEIKKIVKE